jgi:hypothetical protein
MSKNARFARKERYCMAAQLRATLTEIDELSPSEGVSPADEILRRRTERQRQAKGRRSRAV